MYRFKGLPVTIGQPKGLQVWKSRKRSQWKPRYKKGIQARANRLLNIRATTPPEVRWYELSASHDFQTGASTVEHLTTIPKGDSINARDTNKVRAVKLNLNILIDNDPQNTATSWYARFILFKVKRVNGVLPTADELLQGDAVAPTVIRHYNPLQMGKNYKVLWDKTISQPNIMHKHWKFTINKSINTQITWDVGAGATIASAQNNHYFLYGYCSTVAEDVAPRMYYSCVTRFMDE